MYLVAALAACFEWIGEFFDVQTAFLSGKPIDREVYVRAFREGLGGSTADRVRPYALLRLLKGAYGLTEAFCLWYLRAREILMEIGFTEMRCARAVFTLRNKANRLIALLTLHVDDGMLFGDRSDPFLQEGSSCNRPEVQHQAMGRAGPEHEGELRGHAVVAG